MKKTILIQLSVIVVVVCAPLLSSCGDDPTKTKEAAETAIEYNCLHNLEKEHNYEEGSVELHQYREKMKQICKCMAENSSDQVKTILANNQKGISEADDTILRADYKKTLEKCSK